MTPTTFTAAGMSLGRLLAPWLQLDPAQERTIAHLTLDSREVERGSLFAALPGQRQHGLAFLEQVLAQGAAAVIFEAGPGVDIQAARARCAAAGVPLLEVPELTQRLSAIAGRFFGEPSRTLSLVGVTGTDGKTSTSQFLAQALSSDQLPCGVIGTIGWGLMGATVPSTHTTPDPVTVQRLLADMRDLGARHVAMEVSSHALAQGRVAGLAFDVAVLTNLTRDHLDYHGSEAAYAQAKARLFAMPGLRHAVLNLDDAFGRALRSQLADGVQAWGYSLDPHQHQAAVVCRRLEYLQDGLDMTVDTPDGPVEVQLGLLGRFNAANALAALATLLALGLPLEQARARLQALRPVSGRMECFGETGQPRVIVDYAHTPAALAAALDAVRQHTLGRVWCVFGCGGDRDQGKRPQMGAIVDQKADEIVVTDDNPRTEDPDRIVCDIVGGISLHEPFIVRDRAEAIRLAVTTAEPGDAVLVAGKGHETYQIVGAQRLPFDDRAQVQRVLRERGKWNP